MYAEDYTSESDISDSLPSCPNPLAKYGVSFKYAASEFSGHEVHSNEILNNFLEEQLINIKICLQNQQ